MHSGSGGAAPGLPTSSALEAAPAVALQHQRLLAGASAAAAAPAMTHPSQAQPEGAGLSDPTSAAPPQLPSQPSAQAQAQSLAPAHLQAQAAALPPMALPLLEAVAGKLALHPQGLPAGVAPPPAGVPASASSSSVLLAAGSERGALPPSASSASLASSAAGGEGNKTLYLGNLHPFVTEATLQEVFAGLGGVTELKVIKDKATGVSAGYGFAKFADSASAAAALDRVAKAVLFGQEARVNWAFQKEQKEEVAHHFHVFVGDLSSDVTDAMLHGAFANCPGCSDARVMWDHATGRSRGYGFVSFRHRDEADAAIAAMHGQFVGARRVRCGWAQHKADAAVAMDPQILDRADPTNTNVYVGNLAPALTDAEVRRHFGAFGPIAEVKLYRKGSYGFVRYKSHADAVRAIVGMSGQELGGKPVKCSWGRHPNTPPSGVQTSLMLAAAAGIGPLAMGSAGMLPPGGMGPGPGGMGPAHMGMMGGGGGMGGLVGMGGMPMAGAATQSLIHGGQAGMGGGNGLGHVPGAGASQMLGGNGGQGAVLDPAQLQQMAGMQYALPYGAAGMQPGMPFFGSNLN